MRPPQSHLFSSWTNPVSWAAFHRASAPAPWPSELTAVSSLYWGVRNGMRYCRCGLMSGKWREIIASLNLLVVPPLIQRRVLTLFAAFFIQQGVFMSLKVRMCKVNHWDVRGNMDPSQHHLGCCAALLAESWLSNNSQGFSFPFSEEGDIDVNFSSQV